MSDLKLSTYTVPCDKTQLSLTVESQPYLTLKYLINEYTRLDIKAFSIRNSNFFAQYCLIFMVKSYKKCKNTVKIDTI